MELEEFELLSDIPIYIEGVGNVKIPTLRDIRKIGYKTYKNMCQYISIDLHNFLNLKGISDKYEELSEDEKKKNTFYNLMIFDNDFRCIYKSILSFFICGEIVFSKNSREFCIYNTGTDEDGKHSISGKINNQNFDLLRDVLLQINRIKLTEEDEQIKYKNEMARKLAERMEKAAKIKEEKEKNNMSFGKMISKYCADNKNGINILNVWEMTIYQFYDQFTQHNHIRQSDIQDMVYTNTVSFSDLKSYDPQLWLK